LNALPAAQRLALVQAIRTNLTGDFQPLLNVLANFSNFSLPLGRTNRFRRNPVAGGIRRFQPNPAVQQARQAGQLAVQQARQASQAAVQQARQAGQQAVQQVRQASQAAVQQTQQASQLAVQRAQLAGQQAVQNAQQASQQAVVRAQQQPPVVRPQVAGQPARAEYDEETFFGDETFAATSDVSDSAAETTDADFEADAQNDDTLAFAIGDAFAEDEFYDAAVADFQEDDLFLDEFQTDAAMSDFQEDFLPIEGTFEDQFQTDAAFTDFQEEYEGDFAFDGLGDYDFAVGDTANTAPSTSSSGMPAWAVALIVLSVLIVLGVILVVVQLVRLVKA
jgi:hypothetical protein